MRRWSSAGDSLRVLRPSSEWLDVPGQGFGPDSVPRTLTVAIQPLQGDTVAVGLWVARQGWEEGR